VNPRGLTSCRCGITAEKNIYKITDSPEERNPIKGGTAADAKRELWARRIERAMERL